MSIYDPAEEQREISLLKAKLAEALEADRASVAMVRELQAELERLTGAIAGTVEQVEQQRKRAEKAEAARDRAEQGLKITSETAQRDLARAEKAEARVEEFQEHERQTHERLGAILGTDDSLEECAKRLRQRVEELEQELLKIAWVIGSPKDSHRLPEALGYVLASYRQRGEAAEAEVERLREALEKIATFDTHIGCCEVARAALRGGGK